jgi:phage gp36-like protein
MPYVLPIEVTSEIPAPVLRDALDDEGDGQEHPEVLAAVIANASQEVDGYLAGLFTVPFADPAPAKVRAAALAFTVERIYSRREKELPKRWQQQAKFWRDHLQAVGNRELPFDAAVVKAFVPGAAVTSPLSMNAQST